MAEPIKLTPHQRIMRAAKAGKGVRLNAAEVSWLARDQAIITCAGNDDARDDFAEAKLDRIKQIVAPGQYLSLGMLVEIKEIVHG